MKKTYSEKLQDPRWQKKRLEIMDRDAFICQECQAVDKPLHVHHRYYTPRTSPWDYPDDALTTLCEDCHAERTELDARLQKAFGALSYGLVERLVAALEYYDNLEYDSGFGNVETAMSAMLSCLTANCNQYSEPKTLVALWDYNVKRCYNASFGNTEYSQTKKETAVNEHLLP